MTTETNKVAIVTGASGGIGAAVAERLAKDGFTVVVNYAGNSASAAAVVARIEGAGGRAVAAQADISDVAAVARMFDSAETAFGGVDVLINNAGIMNLATIADSSDALFDRHIAVNLKGTFNTLREAARRLRDGGRIVNFSSSVTSLLQPTYGVYAATKAAVEAMTSILAKELRGRNITVNAIAPGPTATKLFLDGKPQEVIDRLSKLAPLERLGQPRGYRRRGGLPRRPGRRLDQRPDAARQWRDDLTRSSASIFNTLTMEPIMSKKIILITGASSGFGRLTAEALAKAGNTVYASMRDIAGRNAKNAAEMAETSKRDGVDLRAIELDVQSEPSIDVAVKKIMAESGKIDVLVHNAGHMMFGPAEAFLPEQFAAQYDVNVLGTQRVNRAVLPHMRAAKQGLLLWISSSSSAGGTPPYLAPYFAAKAAMELAGRPLCAGAVALGHRDDDRRAGRVHQGHEPLRAFRASG